ncbi:bone morphogenetic protein 15 [Lagopus muta]|uniref:bone morphogenetic protein 15 n=1 Tax=Lagopus muta TaxID=64668 RepID=UPI00209FB254|nr:bone morphogenetic protein 15 [Lagopus muta]
MKHDRSAPLILLSPHPLSPTMALLRPFTALLFLTVLLSWAASQTPPLPLLQALREQAPGSQGWRGGAASGQPLRYMLELYRRAADHEGRPRRGRSLSSNTVRLVQAASRGGQPWAGRWYMQPLTYRLGAQPEAEHLLRVTVAYPQSLPLPRGRLLCAVELLPAAEAPAVLLSPAAPSRHGWTEADITPYLPPANSSSGGALTLRHICVRAGRATAANPASPADPFLLLFLNDTRSGTLPEPQRSRREAGTLLHDLPSYLRDAGGDKSDCSLRSFPVSFAQLGWDHWIIAPHRYNPRYCKGVCPRLLRDGYHAPNHAVVQNLVHQLVDASVPRPSCVPYRYSPISVLMIQHDGSILYKEYENMIAESCTCR